MRAGSCVLVVASLISLSLAAPLQPEYSEIESEFHGWIAEHGKIYLTEDAQNKAFETYVANSAIIASLNDNPEDTAVYGHNQFSDMTPEEFSNKYFPRMRMDANEGKRGGLPHNQIFESIPDSFDWRQQGVVTPVKDQGPCGSCWAESAVQNVESVYFISKNKTGNLTPLSTEQVVECDAHDYACYGGFPSGAYRYIIERQGLASEESYPYTLSGHTICLANQTFNETCGDGMCDDPPLTTYCDLTCSDNTHELVASIDSWKALSENETEIAGYLAAYNPVSVALDASGKFGVLAPWLQFYKGGVANPKLCTSTDIDHAVLLVGYGMAGSTPYWTVKNSWGSKWGEQGYFRLVRNQGKCGINTMATTAVINA